MNDAFIVLFAYCLGSRVGGGGSAARGEGDDDGDERGRASLPSYGAASLLREKFTIAGLSICHDAPLGRGGWRLAPIAEYTGPFGKQQAERLLWRAGFGAKAGEAEALAKLGFKHAVHALTRPAPVRARRARPRPPTRAGRSRRPRSSATTTSPGSTGWCGRTRR